MTAAPLEPLPRASHPSEARVPVVPPGGPGVAGAAALAATYAEDLLLGTVRDVHRAVARRTFSVVAVGTLGASTPVRMVHDGIAGSVYGGLGLGLRASARALTAAERQGRGPRLEATPAGRLVASTVNGLIGDRLVEERHGAAITMAVRLRGEDVPVDHAHLAAAFPRATGDVVVFVHGLMEHEQHWWRRADELGGSYGDRLAATSGWSPVYLRVNTGLTLAENGVALASLLDRLVEAWPVPVRRVALVGHSMGGLIVRTACAVRTDAERAWSDLVTDVVTLGTPHLGAPLERGVALGARALGVLPESAPFGRILDTRSGGILGLSRGLPPDVQNLPHARYRLVAATLGTSPWNPLGLALGDLLVRRSSALGQSASGELFPGADTLTVRGDHFDLLNHLEIDRKLRDWLS